MSTLPRFVQIAVAQYYDSGARVFGLGEDGSVWEYDEAVIGKSRINCWKPCAMQSFEDVTRPSPEDAEAAKEVEELLL